MKKAISPVNFLKIVIFISVSIFLINCNSSTSAKTETTDTVSAVQNEPAEQWFKNGQWLNGLKLTPHERINQAEFSRQYQKKAAWWDEAFKFLATRDLEQLAPGNYVIDSGNVIAMVSEGPTKVKDSVKWEAHRNFNDIQYVIKGKAQMGIDSISDPNIKVSVPYSAEDNENFLIDGGDYYDAAPGTFFIFTPKEIHRPAIKVDGYDTIKKIVIKVRVPQ